METNQKLIDDYLKEETELENLVFSCDEEKIRKEFSKLSKNLNLFSVQQLIYDAAAFRPFSYKILGDIFEETGQPLIKIRKNSAFGKYLLHRSELIFCRTDEEKMERLMNIEGYVNPIKPKSLKYYIQHDDVDATIAYLIDNNILSDNVAYEKIMMIVNHVSFGICTFAAFCDAINIVKYLYINKELSPNSAIYAVMGNSERVIDFLASKDVSFDSTLYTAVQYHHNKLAYWLIENYQHRVPVYLTDCVRYHNLEMFFYILYNDNDNLQYLINDIQSKDIYNRTAIFYAVELDDVHLVKLLLEKGAIVDETVKTAAKSPNMRENI